MARTLREAIELGDRKSAVELIRAGHDVSEISWLYIVKPPPNEPYEESLLQLAARLGDVGMIDMLLAVGAPLDEEYYFQIPNQGSFLGRAMDVAAAYGQVQVIETLVRAGSHVVNTEPTDGINPLMMAAMNGHVNAIKAIIKLGGDFFEDESSDYMKAFSYALMYCQYDVIYYFLDYEDFDADEPPEPYEPSPMHYVFRRYRFCLDNGEDVPISKSDKDVMDCVNLLLDYGADPNGLSRHCETDYSLVGCAIVHRQVEVLKRLLEAGADIDVPAMGNLEYEDPYATDLNDFLPLHCPISAVDPRCMKVLLDAGAEDQINSTLIERSTPSAMDILFGLAEDRAPEDYIFSPLHVLGAQGDSIGDERMQDGDAE